MNGLMNNPIISAALRSKNPQAFIVNMMKANPMLENNPMMKSLLDNMQNGNNANIEMMARNLCKEQGVDIDNLLNQLQNIR